MGIIYSTDPDHEFHDDDDSGNESVNPKDQLLYVSIDKKQRKGKKVTLVENFKGSPGDLKSLEKKLKSLCGTGGSSKDGVIIIQGDSRDKIMAILQKEGYKVKRKGG